MVTGRPYGPTSIDGNEAVGGATTFRPGPVREPSKNTRVTRPDLRVGPTHKPVDRSRDDIAEWKTERFIFEPKHANKMNTTHVILFFKRSVSFTLGIYFLFAHISNLINHFNTITKDTRVYTACLNIFTDPNS